MNELLTLEQYLKKYPHLKQYDQATLERLYEEEQLDYVVALHDKGRKPRVQYIDAEKAEDKIGKKGVGKNEDEDNVRSLNTAVVFGSAVSGILVFFIAVGAVAYIFNRKKRMRDSQANMTKTLQRKGKDSTAHTSINEPKHSTLKHSIQPSSQ
uniref:Uncharacterized protein n=1 Tax=Trichuris muris TaxID=70415 RepID=A0A5S6R568_TRIMR